MLLFAKFLKKANLKTNIMALEVEISETLQGYAQPTSSSSDVWFPITLNLPSTTDSDPELEKKFNRDRLIKIGAGLILFFLFILFVLPKLNKA